jgi:hypothetical protein
MGIAVLHVGLRGVGFFRRDHALSAELISFGHFMQKFANEYCCSLYLH